MHIQEDYFIPEIIDPETGEVLPYGEKGELVFTKLVSSSAKDAVEMVEDIKEIYDIPQDTDIGRFIDREDFAELYKAGEYLKELNWTADKCELNDSSLPGAGEEIKSSDMDIKDKERGEEL